MADTAGIAAIETPNSDDITREIASHYRRIRHLTALRVVARRIESEPLDLNELSRSREAGGAACTN